MGKYVVLFVALAALVFGCIWAFDPAYQDMRSQDVYYRSRQQSLELERQQLELREREARSGVVMASQNTVNVLWLAGIVAVLYCGMVYANQRRVPLVRADKRGLLPVARAAIEHGELNALVAQAVLSYHNTQAAHAVHQPGQAPLHYNYSPTHAPATGNTIALTTAEPAAQIEIAPFSALLDAGKVGRNQPLMLAFDLEENKELSGSWLDMYSTAIAGLSGSGKTTSQRFYACQTALHGARFAIVDPHAGAGDDSLAETLLPLRSAFVCEPADNDKAILDTVALVAEMGRERVTRKSADRTPIILWIDELTALLARSTVREPLAELIESIAQEYRKVGIYAAASGQIWSASRTGDSSALRDSFASALVHRMKRSQARMLLPLEDAAKVERLEQGRAILWRTSGVTTLVGIPNTTAADVRRVGAMLDETGMKSGVIIDQTAQPVIPVSSQNQPGAHSGYSALESAKAPTPEEHRIISLFLAGKDAGAIVTELTGMASRAGSPYQKKLSEVQLVIRAALKNRSPTA